MRTIDDLNKEICRQQRKIEDILSSINHIEDTFPEFKFDAEKQRLHDHQVALNEPELQIAIVGTIKAGKSTFINAWLKDELASMDVTPETASLTKFRYSDKNKLIVKFYNKNEWHELWQSVKESELEHKNNAFQREFNESGASGIENQYIGQPPLEILIKDNNDLKKKIKEFSSKQSQIHYFVKELIIEISNQYIPNNVTIVDTPGLDDVVEYRSAITKNYIRNANVVIVCVNSMALRGEEMLTISRVFEQVRGDIYKVLIIGTQIDRLNKPKEDWEKQQKEWQNCLRSCYSGNEEYLKQNIIGISAYLDIQIEKIKKNDFYDIKEKTRSERKLQDFIEAHGVEVDGEFSKWLPLHFDSYEDLTNITKVQKVIEKDILPRGADIVLSDFENRYVGNIHDLRGKANIILDGNRESAESLELDTEKFEEFKKIKREEMEVLQNTVSVLSDTFDKIRKTWIESNAELRKTVMGE